MSSVQLLVSDAGTQASIVGLRKGISRLDKHLTDILDLLKKNSSFTLEAFRTFVLDPVRSPSLLSLSSHSTDFSFGDGNSGI